MRKITTRFLTVLLYIIILLSVLGFQVSLLIDWKSIFLVLIGTLLLSFASIKKGTDREQFKYSLSIHSMAAAYLTTFVQLYTQLVSGEMNTANLFGSIALACRPLLYGYILHLIFQSDSLPDINKPAGLIGIDDAPDHAPATIDAVPQKDTTPESLLEHSDKVILSMEQFLKDAGLTNREIEIALLVKKGCSNKEIAEQLYISDTTVKKHISNIFDKLDLNNREQLRQY